MSNHIELKTNEDSFLLWYAENEEDFEKKKEEEINQQKNMQNKKLQGEVLKLQEKNKLPRQLYH